MLPDGHCLKGWHLHGIDATGRNGGHMLDFKGFESKVTLIPVQEWHVERRAGAPELHCPGGACGR